MNLVLKFVVSGGAVGGDSGRFRRGGLRRFGRVRVLDERRFGQFPVIVSQHFDVLTGFLELGRLHAFAFVPVHERSFPVHEIELPGQSRPRGRNGRRVGHHAERAAAADQLVRGGHGGRGRPAVDAHLEPGRTPFDEPQVLRVPDVRYGVVDVFGHDVTAVKHAARDVLAGGVRVTVQLEQLVAGLETRGRDVHGGRALVRGTLRRSERRVREQREMDARERHQVRLELVDVHVQRAREP